MSTITVVKEELVTEPGPVNDDIPSKDTSSSGGDAGFQVLPNKTINRQIAVVSTLAAVGLFLSARLDFGVSLKDLSASALPYEEVSFKDIAIHVYTKNEVSLHYVDALIYNGCLLWEKY